jgi:hypothetical protein
MDENHYDSEGMELELLAETESYAVLRGADLNGEAVYNVELGPVTLHLFAEEWQELVTLIQAAARR